MWIERDLSNIFNGSGLLEAVLIQGPRQVGKSSLLEKYTAPRPTIAHLDDLAVRTRANSDPALFFSQHPPPIVIDEFHYAPALLPEIKLRIDAQRRERRQGSLPPRTTASLFYLSGSNQIEIDRAVKETLAGRLSIFSLHGLSVTELTRHFPQISPWEILWRGGFPELYVRNDLSPREYINDYISTFIEKDIARSGGITKIEEFLTVARLLAARVGGILNRDSLANDAGVAPKTVSEWIDVLVRTHLVYLLPVYSSNLNSRLTKSPKVYFLDSGIATRLQGHLSSDTILGSPQAGGLFENLVVAEVVKARDHWRIPCEISFWRTKEKEELDLIISMGSRRIFLEIKLAIQGVFSCSIPSSLRREFGDTTKLGVVTVGGSRERISENTERIPLYELGYYLRESFIAE